MFFWGTIICKRFEKNKNFTNGQQWTMTKKLSVKLHAQVHVVIYEIMTADRKSLHTEKQQEITQLNIH